MKTSTKTTFAGMAAAAVLAAGGLAPSAKAIPLVWLDGPSAGSAFAGGAISVKAINYDTGTLYNALPVGSALGYGVGGASGSVAAGETALNGNIARNVLGPSTATYGAASGEDGWGIFKITEINAIGSDSAPHQLYNSLVSPFELTAIFYGVRDFYLNQTSPGSGAAFAGQIIDGSNMHVDFYMDNTKNFNPGGGPGVRISADGYPTVTDGTSTKVLSLQSTAGFINSNGTFGGAATEFESNTANVGYAALDVVGGDAETTAQFDTNAIGFKGTSGAGFLPGVVKNSTDVWFSFTSTPPVSGWDVTSNDPMLANIASKQVPDTGSTLALLACALPVLAAARRRRSAQTA